MDKIISDKVIELVHEIRRNKPRTGTRKLYKELKPKLEENNINIGRDKVHKILKHNDLLINPSKKYSVTTDSKHHFRKHKNQIKNLDINKPELVFVCDITYIRVGNQFAYLFLITDLFSRKIMGWTINFTMKVKDAKKAVRMAHKNRSYKGDLFHHSDRGIQYCTPSYIEYIQKLGMKPSMTDDNHVYENAVAERVNGILKHEFGIKHNFNSLKQARSEIKFAIDTYNNERLHYSIGLNTPNVVHLNPNIIRDPNVA